MKGKEPPHKLRMIPGVYYVWVGGSCDYGHEDRCSGGAYIMTKDEQVVETYIIADDHTTEFRMILSVMIHAMETIPEGSDIVFLTNVSYIQQNFDRQPNEKTVNADLILKCIEMKELHPAVTVKVVPFHKYPELSETHAMAREAMISRRTSVMEDTKVNTEDNLSDYEKFCRQQLEQMEEDMEERCMGDMAEGQFVRSH